MLNHYDIIVIGGGPSGATAATLLARDHRSVVLVDKARFPRDKPCAGAISGRATRLMASIYGAGTLDRLARASSTACRMFHREAFVAEGAGSEPLVFVDRKEMDAALLGAAKESGCTVMEATAAIAVDPVSSAVTLASGEVIRGEIIIGADGVRSVVRQAGKGRGADHKKGIGFGLAADVALDRLKTESLRAACRRAPHIFFGVLPWGYGWIFPKGETVSIGVGGLLGKGGDFRKAFQWLVDTHFQPGVLESLPRRAHLFPFGRFERAPKRGNILLVGDAAGLVEPVTGEGIGLALESAQLAALSAIECLSNQTPLVAGRMYNRLVRQSLLPRLRQAMFARWFLFSKPCLPAAMRSLRRHPNLVSNYLELVSGKMSYPGYIGRLMSELVHRPSQDPSSKL